jgi:CDP-diacylglycerol--glycerol-3-phosphate 3-phosphatidyltransferase
MEASLKAKLAAIPYLLCLARAAAGPALVFIAAGEARSSLMFGLLLFAVVSDIFDGILARKLGTATTRLRTLDSRADMVFWLCATAALWAHRPDFVQEHALAISSVVVSYAATYVVSFLRFGRAPSVHAIFSKFFQLSLLVGLVALLCFDAGERWLYLMVTLGLPANLEVILILLILPAWQHDIPSLYHAFEIRQGREIRRLKLFN